MPIRKYVWSGDAAGSIAPILPVHPASIRPSSSAPNFLAMVMYYPMSRARRISANAGNSTGGAAMDAAVRHHEFQRGEHAQVARRIARDGGQVGEEPFAPAPQIV